ncbi:MAG: RNA polymerase sigma factor [Planctomycetota bacterium]|nr:RNA polymerase sigma factor [Planctomycetota bacterium]
MDTLALSETEGLIKKCLKGDSAAAEALVDLYWDRVYAYAYRLTYNKTDAEDVAQETFLRAFRSLESYKPDGSFKSWLLRVATNIFLDQRKSARNRDVVSGDMSQFVESTHTTPEDIADRHELLQALWQVVQTLSKEQQVVILLRAIERLDYPEIAAILNIKESTARWHMYEARRILRNKLGAKFELGGSSDES